MIWAIVYLVGLFATQIAVQDMMISDAMALWIWFAILVVSSYSMQMSRNVKSATLKNAWMLAMSLFVVLSVAMLLGVMAGSDAMVFGLFLLLNGAVIFAMGHDLKRGDWVAYGLYSSLFGLMFLSWFSATPYSAMAFILGVPLLLGTLKK